MDDQRPGSDFPVAPNPNPEDLPLIHPDDLHKISGFGDLWAAICTIPSAARRYWVWANSTPARRYANAAFAFVVLVAIAVTSMTGNKVPSQNPPPIAAVATHKVVAGENWHSIAQDAGVSWDDLIAANISLARANTAWCRARPVGASYLAGKMPDGKTNRQHSFCELSTFQGETLAVETLKIGQVVTIPAATALADTTTPQ